MNEPRNDIYQLLKTQGVKAFDREFPLTPENLEKAFQAFQMAYQNPRLRPILKKGYEKAPIMNISDRWKLAGLTTKRGLIWSAAMMGKISDEEAARLSAPIDREIMDLSWGKRPPRWKDINEFVQNALGTSAEFLRFQLEGLPDYIKAGIAGAIAGGLAGGPPGMIAGAEVGGAYGVARYSQAVEGGNMYADLVKSGISPNVARWVAVPAGAAIGLVEVFQVRALVPALKALEEMGAGKLKGQILRNIVNETLSTAFEEAGEEATQEVIQIIGETIANDIEKTGRVPSPQEARQRIRDAFLNTFVGMIPFGLISKGVGGARMVVEPKIAPKVAKQVTRIAERVRPSRKIRKPQELGRLAQEAGLTLEEFAALGRGITGKGPDESLTPQEIDAIAVALEEIKRGERLKPELIPPAPAEAVEAMRTAIERRTPQVIPERPALPPAPPGRERPTTPTIIPPRGEPIVTPPPARTKFTPQPTRVEEGNIVKTITAKSKKELLAQIQQVIKEAPEEGEGLIEFRYGRARYRIANNKEALSDFHKKIKGVPEKPTTVRRNVISIPKAKAGKVELTDRLYSGLPQGWFSDGTLICKGKPPKRAQYGEELPDAAERIREVFSSPTTPAQKLYYYYENDEAVGVADTPIAKLDPKAKLNPYVIFKTEKEGKPKYVGYDQFRFNIIANRHPNAKFGITDEGLLIAYEDGEPVAALAPMELKFAEDFVIFADEPPEREMAVKSELISPEEAKPIEEQPSEAPPEETKVEEEAEEVKPVAVRVITVKSPQEGIEKALETHKRMIQAIGEETPYEERPAFKPFPDSPYTFRPRNEDIIGAKVIKGKTGWEVRLVQVPPLYHDMRFHTGVDYQSARGLDIITWNIQARTPKQAIKQALKNASHPVDVFPVAEFKKDKVYYFAIVPHLEPSAKKPSLQKIADVFSKDLESQGVYGEENTRRAREMAVSEILSGYRDLEEAKEAARMLRETNNVGYTKRGFEYDADTLEEAIKIAQEQAGTTQPPKREWVRIVIKNYPDDAVQDLRRAGIPAEFERRFAEILYVVIPKDEIENARRVLGEYLTRVSEEKSALVREMEAQATSPEEGQPPPTALHAMTETRVRKIYDVVRDLFEKSRENYETSALIDLGNYEVVEKETPVRGGEKMTGVLAPKPGQILIHNHPQRSRPMPSEGDWDIFKYYQGYYYFGIWTPPYLAIYRLRSSMETGKLENIVDVWVTDGKEIKYRRVLGQKFEDVSQTAFDLTEELGIKKPGAEEKLVEAIFGTSELLRQPPDTITPAEGTLSSPRFTYEGRGYVLNLKWQRGKPIELTLHFEEKPTTDPLLIYDVETRTWKRPDGTEYTPPEIVQQHANKLLDDYLRLARGETTYEEIAPQKEEVPPEQPAGVWRPIGKAEIRPGDYVRTTWRGKSYEGEVVALDSQEWAKKTKGRFVAISIRTPDGRIVGMPWTSRAKYEKLYGARKKVEPETKPKAKVSEKDIAQARKIRKIAQDMQKQIDQKLNPPIAQMRLTRRRAEIAANLRRQGLHLQRIQAKLLAIADALENGTLPDELRAINSKAIVNQLLIQEHFPRVYIHKLDLRKLYNSIKEREGLADVKRILQLISNRIKGDETGTYLSPPEIDAVEAALKVRGKRFPSHILYESSVADYKRVVKAGIINEDQYQQVRRALLEIGKEREPAVDERAERIREMERKLIGRQIPGYFPTPRPIAEKMLKEADIHPNMQILEPSAGKGNIADVIKEAHPDITLDVIEIHPELSKLLVEKGYKLVADDFLKYNVPQYDRIVMNPPFENKQDIDHVRHAYELLKPGGRLVSIMSEGTFTRSDKKSSEFREWLKNVGARVEKLSEKAFESSERPTGVRTRLVVIDKREAIPTPPAKAPAREGKPAKEPWEMTREEFINWLQPGIELPDGGIINQYPAKTYTWVRYPSDKPGIKGELKNLSNDEIRKQFIEQALSEGKPVPPEVLAEYPDLAEAKPTEAKPEAPAPPEAEKAEPQYLTPDLLPEEKGIFEGPSLIGKRALRIRDAAIVHKEIPPGKAIEILEGIIKSAQKEANRLSKTHKERARPFRQVESVIRPMIEEIQRLAPSEITTEKKPPVVESIKYSMQASVDNPIKLYPQIAQILLGENYKNVAEDFESGARYIDIEEYAHLAKELSKLVGGRSNKKISQFVETLGLSPAESQRTAELIRDFLTADKALLAERLPRKAWEKFRDAAPIIPEVTIEDGTIEITFNKPPDPAIRTQLKNMGFRYSGGRKAWIAEVTDERVALVEAIQDGRPYVPGEQINEPDKPKEEVTEVEEPRETTEEPVEGAIEEIAAELPSGTDGGRVVRVARYEGVVLTRGKEYTRTHDRIDPDIRAILKEHQKDVVEQAIDAYEQGLGYLNAGGTGSGKTMAQLAIAEYHARNGRKVLIVTQNERIIRDAFYPDAKLLGMDIGKGQIIPKSATDNPITIIPYTRLKDHVNKGYQIVLFDEAHNLKNWQTSQKAKLGLKLIEQADQVIYSTASPIDKPEQLWYLHPLGIFDTTDMKGLSKSELIRRRKQEFKWLVRQLGLEWVETKRGGYWRRQAGVSAKEVARRISALFDKLGREGLVHRAEVSLDNLDVEFRTITLTDETMRKLNDIESAYEAQIASAPPTQRGLLTARMLMAQRRHQEPDKIPQLMEIIDEELSDPKRQVIVFMEGINPTREEIGGRIIAESPGALQTLREFLEAKGIGVSEVTGRIKDAQAEVRKFQEGKNRVLIATRGSAGAGLNLDDTVGDRPRTMIIVTAPFSAMDNLQMAGRHNRLTTKSRAKLIYLFADTNVDAWNRKIISRKMKALGATVKGEIEKLDVADTTDVKSKREGEAPDKIDLHAFPNAKSVIGAFDNLIDAIQRRWWMWRYPTDPASLYLMAQYENIREQRFAWRDPELLKARIEVKKLQRKLKEAYMLLPTPVKQKYSLLDFDQAIHIYIDLQRNPGDLNLVEQLSPDKRRIVALAQNLPEPMREIAKSIEASYKALGEMAKDAGVIQNVLEHYVGRQWDLGRDPAWKIYRKFSATTPHALPRKLPTIISGWAKGYRLKVKGATNNLLLMKEHIIKTIADRRFINALNTIKTPDGKPLLAYGSQLKSLEGYKEIKNPRFRLWKWRGKVNLAELSEEEKSEMRRGGAYRDLDTFIDEGGNIFKRERLYAIEPIAKDLNNILGVSILRQTPMVRSLLKLNTDLKSWNLLWSMFHHTAFMRSYLLGTYGKTLAEHNPLKAYKTGLEMIEQQNPIIMLGVKNGLTLGIKQEWIEELRQERGIIQQLLDKWGVSKKVKDKVLALRDWHVNWLFEEFGAGLKAQAFVIEFRNLQRQYPDKSPDEIAKMAANLINDDFGGLHLERLGRNPTVQDLFRLFALAPDWTESNIRTMVKMISAGGKEERDVYRLFWVSVMSKGLILTALANLLLAGFDDDELKEMYKHMLDQPQRLLWMQVDITPLYRALGGKDKGRKYVSLLGHFEDPARFLTNSPILTLRNKGSVLFNIAADFGLGFDFAHRRFTTTKEFLGIDYEKGRYKRTVPGKYYRGMPKWGKLKGKLVTWDYHTSWPLPISAVPIFLLYEVRERGLPAPISDAISVALGEWAYYRYVGGLFGFRFRSKMPKKQTSLRSLRGRVIPPAVAR